MNRGPLRISKSHNILIIVSTLGIIGLASRLYFALILPVGWDQGTFLYWASLINSGATPYRDFFLRDPGYIYLVALSTRYLGSNFFALSLISTVPGTLTIPVIYKATKEIFDKWSGLIASVAYSLSPTVIWYTTVFDERTLMLFLSTFALLLLARGVRTRNPWLFVMYGIILGASTFVYRGIAIYIVTVPLLLAFLFWKREGSQRSFRTFLAYSSAAITGFVFAAGVIFAYFSFNSSLNWMLSNFGFGGQQESASYFIYGEVAVPSFKARVFDVAVREWLYLVAPAGLLVLAVVFGRLLQRRRLATGIAAAIVSGFLLVSVAGLTYFPQNSFGAYEPSWFYGFAFLAFLVLLPTIGGILFPDIARRILSIGRLDSRHALVIYWFLSTALLVALFGVPLVNYYYYFAPVITIIAAPGIKSIIELLGPFSLKISARIPRNPFAFLFLGLLLLNALLTTGMLLNTEMTWRNQPSSTINDIASYIQANTDPQDQILVGNPAIAMLAHRKIALGISEMQIYGKPGPEPFNPIPYDPFHLFPNVSQIAKFMSAGNVKYVVGDNSPPMLFIMSLHPIWENAFATNFVLAQMIDGIPIFQYSPIWDLSQHMGNVIAFSNSTSYNLVDNTWTDGFNHLLVSSISNTILPTVGGLTKPDQVAFLPPIGSGNSFIQAGFQDNPYGNLTTTFALADAAIGKSNGVTYSLEITVGNQSVATLSEIVTSNSWQRVTIPIPTNVNVTIVLVSSSGQSSDFDWLQVTFTLQR